MRLIDTHAHLQMRPLRDALQDVLHRAKEAGVEAVVTVGTDLEDSQEALRLSEAQPMVYATVGLHPHDARELSPELLQGLRELARRPGVVAIGETGLDYHKMHSPKEAQLEAFRAQLALAKELNLPVVVHSREAKADTLRCLKEFSYLKGVMHCFSADVAMAEQAMAMGLYISFSGVVSFQNARRLREVAAQVPDEYLLLETDAPYLAPEPHRGRSNEPAYLVHTAQALAELRGVSAEDIARITTLNARRLFALGGLPREGAIAYKIRQSLYLNITNRCTNACSFCVRFRTEYVKGHRLRLREEPSAQALKEAIGEPTRYREVVFCGYGEPTLRLEVLKEVAAWVKHEGGRVRLNTNGHGNLIHGRNILPELRGLVDAVSVSLDAQDAATYERLCRPAYWGAFQAVLDFIREAKKHIPQVEATVVTAPGVDIPKCQALCQSLGVPLRVRRLHVVG